MLEARHLVKRYAGSRVVDDVSFVVRPGEVLGYLGPNGSGKSTTAHVTAGRAVGGHVWSRAAHPRDLVGYGVPRRVTEEGTYIRSCPRGT